LLVVTRVELQVLLAAINAVSRIRIIFNVAIVTQEEILIPAWMNFVMAARVNAHLLVEMAH